MRLAVAMHHVPNRAVLVVDAVVEDLSLAERTLGWRFHISTARTGEDALNWLASHTFAAVIADQRLPGVAGDQVLAHAAANAPDTARILVTSQSDLRGTLDVISGVRPAAILTKPIDPERLLAEVENAVAQFNTLVALRKNTQKISAAAEKIRRATPLLGMPVIGKLKKP